MAIEQRVYDMSLDSIAALSTHQFKFLMGSGAGVDLCTAASENLIGVLQNKPAASGVACEIRRVGITKIECGGAITAWDKVTSNALGLGVTAADGERYGGIALEAGVTGRLISMLVEFGYVETS